MLYNDGQTLMLYFTRLLVY